MNFNIKGVEEKNVYFVVILIFLGIISLTLIYFSIRPINHFDIINFDYTKDNIKNLSVEQKMFLCGIQYPSWINKNIIQPFPDIRKKCLEDFAKLEARLR